MILLHECIIQVKRPRKNLENEEKMVEWALKKDSAQEELIDERIEGKTDDLIIKIMILMQELIIQRVQVLHREKFSTVQPSV